MDKQSCGNCAHWSKYRNRKTIGICMAPYPVWVVITEYDTKHCMKKTDGTDCPTWAPVDAVNTGKTRGSDPVVKE